MRSTKIVIFLVLLNGSALLVGATGLGPALGVDPAIGGDEQISEAEESVEEIDQDRSQLDLFTGGLIEAVTVLTSIFAIITAGPQMLINLGGPMIEPFIIFLSAPLYLIIGLDILNALIGGGID